MLPGCMVALPSRLMQGEELFENTTSSLSFLSLRFLLLLSHSLSWTTCCPLFFSIPGCRLTPTKASWSRAWPKTSTALQFGRTANTGEWAAVVCDLYLLWPDRNNSYHKFLHIFFVAFRYFMCPCCFNMNQWWTYSPGRCGGPSRLQPTLYTSLCSMSVCWFSNT